MKNKLLKSFTFILFTFILISPCYSFKRITNEVVNDYIDMANLYQNNNNYCKALDYITMIEPYDEFNPQVIYKKADLLRSTNNLESAKKEMEKLILLNNEYVCSDLALAIYGDGYKDYCCKGR